MTTIISTARLLSARDAEKVLGIPASTIRTWYARRRTNGLYEFGRDKRNAPLFRATDLTALRAGHTLREPTGARRT